MSEHGDHGGQLVGKGEDARSVSAHELALWAKGIDTLVGLMYRSLSATLDAMSDIAHKSRIVQMPDTGEWYAECTCGQWGKERVLYGIGYLTRAAAAAAHARHVKDGTP